MTVHILLLAYISVCGAIVYSRGVTLVNNKRFLYLAFFGILLIQALRSYRVGIDTVDYYFAFYSIRNNTFGRIVSSWEPLYLLLNKAIGLFTSNPQWLFAIGSLMIDVGVIIFIINNVEDGRSAFWPVLYWVVFLNYLNSMNLFRQYIAMAFVCNIYTILVKERSRRTYIISLMLLIIGMGFHYTSIIGLFILIPFIMKWDSKKAIIYASILSLLILLLSGWLLQIGIFLFPKYRKYLGTFLFEGGDIGGFYIGIAFLRFICISVVFLLLSHYENDKKHIFTLSFYMILSIAIILLKTRFIIVKRLIYFFDVFQIIYFSRVIDKFKNNAVIKLFIYVFCWGIYVYTLHTYDGSRGCVPYTFFWQ